MEVSEDGLVDFIIIIIIAIIIAIIIIIIIIVRGDWRPDLCLFANWRLKLAQTSDKQTNKQTNK